MTTASATSQAETSARIRIAGQEVEVTQIQYRRSEDGHRVLHTAKLIHPTRLTFARGNAVEFSDSLFFYDNGAVWMAGVAGPASAVKWVLPDGRSINLDCAPRTLPGGGLAPVKQVIFSPSGEFLGGCRAVDAVTFQTPRARLVTDAGADVALTEQGDFLYASRLLEGRLHLQGQNLQLEAGSEVDLFSDGQPHFFKMKAGELLRLNSPRLGAVVLGSAQTGEASHYTVLTSDGGLEAGELAQPAEVAGIEFGAGSLFHFQTLDQTPEDGQDRRELTIRPKSPVTLTLGGQGQPYQASQVNLDAQNRITGFISSRAFVFRSPEGQTLNVPAGAVIYLSSDGRVLRIDIPNPVRPGPLEY
jgi:hypothetical protein